MKLAAIPTGALRVLSPVVLILFLFATASASQAQTERRYPGRGAISAQDFAKLTSPAANGISAADQVCARYTAGSIVSDPPVLQSQNGVLEVTMGFYTVTDSQGLVRYCYVTNTGLEAPTLIVNPGDSLIIHFQNDMLGPSATSASHMASMKMTLSNNDGTTSTSSACNGKMGVRQCEWNQQHRGPRSEGAER
jgi:hypothetical protein